MSLPFFLLPANENYTLTREYTASRQEANTRYDEKTQKNYLFKLRKEDDKDIIESIEQAKQNGINKRDWLKELFEGKK